MRSILLNVATVEEQTCRFAIQRHVSSIVAANRCFINPRPKNRNRFLFLTQLVAVAGGVLFFGGGSYCV